MCVENDLLLKQYYQHLQHTEKERSKFLQILIGVSGAGFLGADKYLEDPRIRAAFYLFMVFISSYSYLIMKKYSKVVWCYTRAIRDIIINEECDLFDCLTGDEEVQRDEQHISVSNQYENIVLTTSLFYILFCGVNVMSVISDIQNKYLLLAFILVMTHGYVYCIKQE